MLIHKPASPKSLLIAIAQCLHGPAGKAEIAVCTGSFEIDGRTQPVVAADIIAAQERAVAGIAAIAGQAPVLAELEAAIRLDIAAEHLLLRIAIGDDPAADVDARAAGEVGGGLEGALVGQLAVAGREHRQRAREDRAGERQILVGRKAPVIGIADLRPVGRAEAEIGNQQAAFRTEI